MTHDSRASVGFTDIHGHPMPAVDDGPEDLATSLAWLRRAFDGGTRRVVATPHLYHPSFSTSVAQLEEAFESWQEALAAKSSEPEWSFLAQLDLVLGAECMLGPELLGAADRGEALTLGGGPVVLVELPPYLPSEATRAGLSRLTSAGYTPLLAHAERYPELVEGGDRRRALERTGCWLQVNAGALHRSGRSGWLAHRLLCSGRVVAVASDGHDAERRVPDLGPAATLLARRYGGEVTHRWLHTGPSAVLAGEPLDTLELRPRFLRRWRFPWPGTR